MILNVTEPPGLPPKNKEFYRAIMSGHLVTTQGVLLAFEAQAFTEVSEALANHFRVERGDLCEEDHEGNLEALEIGDRIMTTYKIQGEDLWIITDAGWKEGHKVTTLLLPSEY
jgi:hypothetical protein